MARCTALTDIGCRITPLDLTPYLLRLPYLWRWVEARLLWGPRTWLYNRALVAAAEETQPDVIWIEKGRAVWPCTLQKLKDEFSALLVHYTPDPVYVPGYRSRHYFKAMTLYDVHFTTKSYEVERLKRGGARRVMLIGKGFDPAIHCPQALSQEELSRLGADVSFIGRWEPDREEILITLAKVLPAVKLKVWGENWYKARRPDLLRDHLQGRPVWHIEYAKTICATKINLCFLSKRNRDQVTARSVEIPACGGFMLGDRTEEHLAYFQEGKEAEFFSDLGEMVEKIEYYLQKETARKQIAEAGRQRCLMSWYSNQDRMRQAMDVVAELLNRGTLNQ